MTRTMAEAFDEWMRLYIEDPAGFEAEFQSVAAHQRGIADGNATEYGNRCAGMLQRLMARGMRLRGSPTSLR